MQTPKATLSHICSVWLMYVGLTSVGDRASHSLLWELHYCVLYSVLYSDSTVGPTGTQVVYTTRGNTTVCMYIHMVMNISLVHALKLLPHSFPHCSVFPQI